jgi:hypothetical protein
MREREAVVPGCLLEATMIVCSTFAGPEHVLLLFRVVRCFSIFEKGFLRPFT